METPPPLDPKAHLVLVRFGSLGDVVKCTALPRLIKAAYPASRITFVTSSAYLDLIRDNPYIDRPLALPKGAGLSGLTRMAQELRAEGIDLVVDVHRSLRSRILCWLLRTQMVVYSKRTLQRWLLIRFRINTYGTARGKEEDFLAPLLPYGVRDDSQGTRLYLDRVAADGAMRARMADALDQIERWRKAKIPILGIAPIAAWPMKCWPMAHFRALVDTYLAHTRGAVVVFGGLGDTEAQALSEGRTERVFSLVGRTSHLESAYFASLTDLVVANDTGMTHLTEAAGRDVITLFGPTSRELGYYPSRSGSVAVERDLPCRPCTRMGEGRCTHPLPFACLVGITPEHVLTLVLDKIGSPMKPAVRGAKAALGAGC